jgi:cobalt/nickel transport system permease protein
MTRLDTLAGQNERRLPVLGQLNPICRLFCAFTAAASLSALYGVPALALGSLLPLALVFADGPAEARRLSGKLAGINKISAAVWLLLPLTYPGARVCGVFSREGIFAAFILTWKLNLMSIVLIRMMASMDAPEISSALAGLGCPEKLRTLFLLTARYIFMLRENISTTNRAAVLRSNGNAGLETYACMVGTTLINSADKAERASLAMICRGGMGGFVADSSERWGKNDYAAAAIFLSNAALCLAAAYFSRG